MSDSKHSGQFSPSTTQIDRRSLIKKALSIGTIGYVAPMVLGSTTSVSAQAVSGTFCPANDTCFTFSCGGGFCACVPTIEGGRACVTPSCTGITCTSSAHCAAGQVCFTLGCCSSGNFCVPLCGLGGGGSTNTEP